MELIQKFADTSILNEDNIVPRLNYQDILNDNYELTTFFGKDKVNTKITVEIEIIEEALENSINLTKVNLLEFKDTLNKYSPNLSLDSYWKASSTTIEEEIRRIDNFIRIVKEIELLYIRSKDYSKTLDPILQTGGYRSLLICLNESLIRIYQSIEAVLSKKPSSLGTIRRRKNSLFSTFRSGTTKSDENIKEQSGSYSSLRKSKEEPIIIALKPRKTSHRRTKSQEYKNKSGTVPPITDSGSRSSSLPKSPRRSRSDDNNKNDIKSDNKDDNKDDNNNKVENNNEEPRADGKTEFTLGGSIVFGKSSVSNEKKEKEKEKETKYRSKAPRRTNSNESKLEIAEEVSAAMRKQKRREKREKKEKEMKVPFSAPNLFQTISNNESTIEIIEERIPTFVSVLSNSVELRRSVLVSLPNPETIEAFEQNIENSLAGLEGLDSTFKDNAPITDEEFNRAKINLEKVYTNEKDKIKLTKELERERLKLLLKEVDREEKEELYQLDKNIRTKLKALEERVEVKAEVKTTFGSKSNQFKLVCVRCAKSADLLENLKDKLVVCTNIVGGTIFLSIDDLYAPHPDIDRNSVFARHHFGYELNKDLKEYSKKMKVVYCAVADSRYPDKKSKEQAIKGIIKQMYFSWAAVKYSLSSKKSSNQYGDLRANLDVNYVKDVWDLLEDPLTNFFATQFGFAPAMEKMKINVDLRIPVKATEIFDVKLPQYQKKKEKKIEWEDDEDVDTPFSGKHYRIRCRYISQYANDVDPALILKSLKSRTNFVEEFVPELPEKERRRSHTINSSVDFGEIPEALQQNAIVIHIHGGGWVSQSPDQHLPYVSEWGKYAQLPVLSIDYSLSPEVQYPIPVNECFAIYKWVQDPANVKKLGLPVFKDPIRVILCGDSAGGNLSCATTIRAIQENIRLPIGLLLHYPAINLTESGSLSRLIFSNDPILNYETMRVVLDCYLGDMRNDAQLQPLMSPGLANDEILSKFPSTVICVGDVDPLIDDSTYLFSRLQSLGVNVIMKVYRALPHGFLNLPTQLPKAGNAIAEAGVYLEWLFKEYLEKLSFEEEKKRNGALSGTHKFIDGTRLRFRSTQDLAKFLPSLNLNN